MIGFIISLFLVIWIFATYEKRQHKIKQRKMDEEIHKAKEQQQNQPKGYEVDLPNPATVSIYRIADFLQKEYRIAVLEKYIEVAREYKADDQVITMIENRLAEVRQLLKEM